MESTQTEKKAKWWKTVDMSQNNNLLKKVNMSQGTIIY